MEIENKIKNMNGVKRIAKNLNLSENNKTELYKLAVDLYKNYFPNNKTIPFSDRIKFYKKLENLYKFKKIKDNINNKKLKIINDFIKKNNLPNNTKNSLYISAKRLYNKLANNKNISEEKFLSDFSKKYLISYDFMKSKLKNKINKNTQILKRISNETNNVNKLKNTLNDKIKNLKDYIETQNLTNKNNIINKIDNIVNNVDNDNSLTNIDKIHYKKTLINKLLNTISLSFYDENNNNISKDVNNKYSILRVKKPYLLKNNKKKNLKYFNNSNIILVPQNILNHTKKEFMNLFGIDKLTKYTDNEKDQLLDYLLEYSIPLNENTTFTNKNYIKTDLYLLKMSDILIKSKLEKSFYNLNNPLSKGAYGSVYLINNKIYRLEKLRFVEGELGRYKFPYRFYNYIASTIFLSFVLQNFLHQKFPTIIPDVLDLDFGYKNDYGVTIMNYAFNNINNNKKYIIYDFYNFVKNESYRKTFIKDFYNILINLCQIITELQDYCCFVHNDIHFNNLLIKYNYNNNNGFFEYNIKLIDFGLSSIVINYNNQLRLLKYVNLRPFKFPLAFNPYTSTMWYKYDLLYFINILLFKHDDFFEDNLKINNLKNNEDYIYDYNYDEIIHEYIIKLNNETNIDKIKIYNYRLLCVKIYKIFNICISCRHNYKVYLRESIKANQPIIFNLMFKLTQNKYTRDKIYGSLLKIENFNPRILKNILESETRFNYF